MINPVRDNFTLLKKCGRTLVLFELIYKAVAVALFYPLFLALFQLTLKCAGIKYLTNGYIIRYLASPATIAAIIFIFLLIAGYNFFEKCCMSVLFEASHAGQRISVPSMFAGGLRSFRIKGGRYYLQVLLYEVFLFPFSNIAVLGLVLVNLSLPEFVTRAFGSRNSFYMILFFCGILLFVLAVREIFTTNYLLYCKGDFKRACKNSAALVSKRVFRTVLLILFWNMLVALFVAVVFIIISVFVVVGVILLDMTHTGIALYLTVFKTVQTLITLGLILISSPFSYMVITGMFFRYRFENEGREWRISSITENLIRNPAVWRKGSRRITAAAVTLSIALICMYFFLAAVSNPFDRVEFFQIPDITAHRGSSLSAPENTMAAFEGAVADMADYIELDVHLTSDGVVVVIHDDSLKRTAGLNRNIWQTDYSVVRKLDAGSWFSAEYAGEKIPTLEEVINEIGDSVKLNIEIKYNKREQGLTGKVVELIEKYELEDRCIVTSMDYQPLMEVKQRNGKIRTGYVLSAAYGSFYSIGYVDVISINYNFVNKAMVDAIHGSGKEIYVWTVNSADVIQSLANMGVDNIITDDPVMAREAVYSRYSVREIVSILNYVFKRKGY